MCIVFKGPPAIYCFICVRKGLGSRIGYDSTLRVRYELHPEETCEIHCDMKMDMVGERELSRISSNSESKCNCIPFI